MSDHPLFARLSEAADKLIEANERLDNLQRLLAEQEGADEALEKALAAYLNVPQAAAVTLMEHLHKQMLAGDPDAESHLRFLLEETHDVLLEAGRVS